MCSEWIGRGKIDLSLSRGLGVTPSLREAKLDISLSERGVKLFQWEVKKNRVLFTRVS